MNKTDLVNTLTKEYEFDNKMTKAQIKEVVDAFIEVITDTLAKGEDVALTGFGRFKVTTRSARTGRNPQTGEVIQIPESNSVHFTAGAGLKDAVKGVK